MDSAIVGLVGAAVGGAISVATTLLVERNKDRREERAELREERQALRLVHQELLTIQFDFDAAIDNETWWNRAALKFETPAWDRFGHTVAASAIDENSWGWIAHAYDEIARVNEVVERNRIEARNAGRRTLRFGDDALTLAKQMQNSVSQGVDFLSAYMNGEPSPVVAVPNGS